MAVTRLRIENFRNLALADISPASGFNILTGDNGAGKSSVLEALHVIGTGKSFRIASPRALVSSGKDSFTLSADLQPGAHRLGIKRGPEGPAEVVVNQTRVRSASGLAERLPVLVMSMNDFRLFEDGPRVRRAFLDWVVFHAGGSQARLFNRFTKALKQRNRLLKNDTIDPTEKGVWDQEFVLSSEALDAARQRSVAALSEAFDRLLAELGLVELEGRLAWSLFSGWNKRKGDMAAQLASTPVQEKERAYRRCVIGPQRSELRFTVDGLPAAEVLSRGQMKVYAHLLKLALVRVLEKDGRSTGQGSPVLLLDDIAAELDSRYLTGILGLLRRMESQVFITAVAVSHLPAMAHWAHESSVSLFHVEHGEIHE